MKIAIASDHRGFQFKERILSQVAGMHYQVLDFGPPNEQNCDYPDCGAKVAHAVSNREVDRAILIGGTGIGMCIVANKFRGVRAVLCHDKVSAELSRCHYDANILCLSADLLGEQLATRMVEVWLATSFAGGHHERRIAKIAGYEKAIREGLQAKINGANTGKSTTVEKLIPHSGR